MTIYLQVYQYKNLKIIRKCKAIFSIVYFYLSLYHQQTKGVYWYHPVCGTSPIICTLLR